MPYILHGALSGEKVFPGAYAHPCSSTFCLRVESIFTCERDMLTAAWLPDLTSCCNVCNTLVP